MKPTLKSGRTDVRALDGLFVLFERMSTESIVRILRFYLQSQCITAERLFPERFR